MMNFHSLVKKTRSCRRFLQQPTITIDVLEYLVDLSRISASAANLQPLKYILSCHPEKNAAIFDCLGWAGFLKDWAGPKQDERPTGYIIMLGDKTITKNFEIDTGIAAQTIMLGACDKGFSGCMIANIHHLKLADALKIEDHYAILLVLALGAPKETVVIDPINAEGNFRYFRDENGIHHVPKRSSEEIIVRIF